MRARATVSLFPFLSVLISTMGVLSFLAITFLLFASTHLQPEPPRKIAEVKWVGAPAYVRPLLVECRADGIVLHTRDGSATRTFSREALQREVKVVRDLVQVADDSLGPAVSRTQLWLFLKSVIPHERRLRNSFTLGMHAVEIDNVQGGSRRKQVERYPILLVYPEGVETYELAAYLVETTTRLAIGLEPMLDGWELPYQEHAS